MSSAAPGNPESAVAMLEAYLTPGEVAFMASAMKGERLWQPYEGHGGRSGRARIWVAMSEDDRSSPRECLLYLSGDWKAAPEDSGDPLWTVFQEVGRFMESLPDTWDVGPEEWRLSRV